MFDINYFNIKTIKKLKFIFTLYGNLIKLNSFNAKKQEDNHVSKVMLTNAKEAYYNNYNIKKSFSSRPFP